METGQDFSSLHRGWKDMLEFPDTRDYKIEM